MFLISLWRCILLLEHYSIARPYLYHLTHRQNLSHIRQMACLVPAAILMERAGRADLIRTRRRGHERVTIESRVIVLRDQSPLHKGNAKLPRGYTFEGFLESLNRRIFFWPGNEAGPIAYGIRHFQHYENENPIMLRMDFESLLRANPLIEPLYCRYNSGSPRCSHGKKSPRGPNTFVSANNFLETPGKVVEVTFDSEILLPRNAESSSRPSGPWRLLF
jgi:hypothetical protein